MLELELHLTQDI